MWVCGAILAGSSCQNAVASALSTGGGNWNRFRQWLYDDSAGPGPARPNWT